MLLFSLPSLLVTSNAGTDLLQGLPCGQCSVFPFLYPYLVNYQVSLGCFTMPGTYIIYNNKKEVDIGSKGEIAHAKYPNFDILTINAHVFF